MQYSTVLLAIAATTAAAANIQAHATSEPRRVIKSRQTGDGGGDGRELTLAKCAQGYTTLVGTLPTPPADLPTTTGDDGTCTEVPDSAVSEWTDYSSSMVAALSSEAEQFSEFTSECTDYAVSVEALVPTSCAGDGVSLGIRHCQRCGPRDWHHGRHLGRCPRCGDCSLEGHCSNLGGCRCWCGPGLSLVGSLGRIVM